VEKNNHILSGELTAAIPGVGVVDGTNRVNTGNADAPDMIGKNCKSAG
jgi:hypothetical protein